MNEEEKAQRNDAGQLMQFSKQERSAEFDRHSIEKILPNEVFMILSNSKANLSVSPIFRG